MAERIEATLTDAGVFIAESGTGTGKTFAYLVPVLRSGKKTLISSGTRHLQDQIYHRDPPLVRMRWGYRSAWRCSRAGRIISAAIAWRAPPPRGGSRAATKPRISRNWSRGPGGSRRGDIAEVSEIPEDAELWPFVTSTAENCLGGDCPDFDKCCVNAARREALAADVVVVNHHLFFADLALREEGSPSSCPASRRWCSTRRISWPRSPRYSSVNR